MKNYTYLKFRPNIYKSIIYEWYNFKHIFNSFELF